jgi:hypothetical protein
MTECPHCHTVLPEPPDRFCPNCGADLLAATAAGVPPPLPPVDAAPPPLPGEYSGGGSAPPPGYGSLPPYGTAPAGGGGTPWDRRGTLGFLGALIETTKQVLTEPAAFFRAMPVAGGLGPPMLYAVIIGYVGLVATTIYNLVFRSVLSSSMTQMGSGGDLERLAPFLVGTTSLIVNLLFGPVFIVMGLFIGAGLFHLMLLAFGGATRGFEATFRVAAFSQAASIFNVVPGCGGLIGLVYTLVLLVIGLSEAHQISRGKAAAAVLVPFVLICCCCAAIGVLAAMGIAGALGQMGR